MTFKDVQTVENSIQTPSLKDNDFYFSYEVMKLKSIGPFLA